jgi:diaminopimelate decarboxylase
MPITVQPTPSANCPDIPPDLPATTMHSFHYHDQRLFCEGVDLATLAEKHGTPLYVYSKNTITDHFDRLDQGLDDLDHLICYAVKANSNLAILNLLAERGSGFDIVSAGELYRVIKAGGDPAKCTFAGVGKTENELTYALEQGIYSFNVESEAELCFINKIAGKLGKTAPVALRVNPNVDARTHKYISTGKSENKFGIDFDRIEDAYARAARDLPHIRLLGLQMHIGSQLTSIAPFVEAVSKVAPLAARLKAQHNIEFFSVGGGIGIIYQGALDSGSPDWWENKDDLATPLTVAAYATAVVPALRELGLKIIVEPGRYMVGNAGVLLSRVLYEKRGTAKTFTVIDAGMNDLIRPALYEGHHDIVPLNQPAATTPTEKVDIVGPICETGDFFCQDRVLPALAQSDLIAVLSSGAYGFVMASNYNSRPLPAEVLVAGEHAKIIRERQTLADLVAGECIPG